MAKDGKSKGGYVARGPRVAIRCAGLLVEADGCVLDVLITDVSRDGFRLESNGELEVGAEVLISVGKAAPVRAVIRWTRGFEAGGIFLEPVNL